MSDVHMNLDEYNISKTRGFLPDQDPLTEFETEHEFLDEIERMGSNIPALLESSDLRLQLQDLEAIPEGLVSNLTPREVNRLYSLSGFLASAYVHKVGDDARSHIPVGPATSLDETSAKLDVPPILSYDGYALYNWKLYDDAVGFTPHNLDTLCNFVSLRDEIWFIVIHIVIEEKAGPAIASAASIQNAVQDSALTQVKTGLNVVEDSLHEIVSIMERMPEHNSRDVYGNSFRPYIDQFKNIEYRGVGEFETPQSFRGETGAQSSLFPTLDALLDIDHREGPLTHHIDEMRKYMPVGHRRYISDIEEGSDLRTYVIEAQHEPLTEIYNTCIDHLVRFREIHNEYAMEYIMEPLGDEYGTGGTPYGQFLSDLIEDTKSAKI